MDELIYGFKSALGMWMRLMKAEVGKHLWVTASVVKKKIPAQLLSWGGGGSQRKLALKKKSQYS